MITIEQIKETVAAYFGLPVLEMDSARRSRSVARPRQIAMFFCKRMTPRSLPEIGRHFGQRDHTTVMHACETIGHLRATSEVMRGTLLELELRLQAVAAGSNAPLQENYEVVVDRVLEDLRKILLATRPKHPGQILGPIADAFSAEETGK